MPHLTCIILASLNSYSQITTYDQLYMYTFLYIYIKYIYIYIYISNFNILSIINIQIMEIIKYIYYPYMDLDIGY